MALDFTSQQVWHEWRPFVSAPTDGTVVLAWRDDADVFTAHYISPMAALGKDVADDDTPLWFTTNGDDLSGDLPTYWMPLPPPPKSV